MNTARFKILPALVMFEFSSGSDLLRKRLLAAILNDACPDFECSLGSPSGKGNSYTALWRVEHAEAVHGWAQSIGLSILNTDGAPSPPHPEVGETSSTCIQLPDIGDIAPGGVVATCLADVERLLADQDMEPNALNWLMVYDHFLSQSLICAEHRRMLRQTLERVALAAVKIAGRPSPQRISQEDAE